MLFTQQFAIPESGSLRVGTIGGSPYADTPEGEMQVGYMTPPRKGLVRVTTLAGEEEITNCIFDVSGYNDNPINGAKAPGRVIVELPCSVVVSGPPDTIVLVEAWECDAFPDRGAALSLVSPIADPGAPIPLWASSFDLSEPGIATFRNTAGAIVGVVTGSVVNFSVPSGASTVSLASTTANTSLVFRQQG